MVEFVVASKMGRPSDYTQELADLICERLADGESLRKICRDESMPSGRTVFNWLRSKPEFLQQYTRAKEESADAHAEDMLEIADDSSRDRTEDGQADSEHIARSRLRVETRKWLASKLKPKKYGDTIKHEGAGPNGEHVHRHAVDWVVHESPAKD